MPKLKSHSGAKKRFRKTGTGKIKYRKSNAQHLLTGKPSKRMRYLKRTAHLDPASAKIVSRLIPYA